MMSPYLASLIINGDVAVWLMKVGNENSKIEWVWEVVVQYVAYACIFDEKKWKYKRPHAGYPVPRTTSKKFSFADFTYKTLFNLT